MRTLPAPADAGRTSTATRTYRTHAAPRRFARVAARQDPPTRRPAVTRWTSSRTVAARSRRQATCAREDADLPRRAFAATTRRGVTLRRVSRGVAGRVT